MGAANAHDSLQSQNLPLDAAVIVDPAQAMILAELWD